MTMTKKITKQKNARFNVDVGDFSIVGNLQNTNTIMIIVLIKIGSKVMIVKTKKVKI